MENTEKEFSLFDYYILTDKKHVLISYKGPITDVIMSEISRDIRYKFSDNPKASKKLFSIFMELTQNILYYSSEKINFAGNTDSLGVILITQYEDYYRFACGNLVDNTYIDELAENCNYINSLDKEALREYKRVQRSAPQTERSKGAGIGLIHVAITSENPLDIEFRRIDKSHSFFSISVKINM